MQRTLLAGLALAALAGAASAKMKPAEVALGASLKDFAELVNQGKSAEAIAYFAASPSIVEDLAPYRWQGPTAPKAWIDAMMANAERAGMSGVNMHFSDPATVQITGARAYAVMPGELTYTFKDGHLDHAHGHVIFSLHKLSGAWRIETLAWGWERP